MIDLPPPEVIEAAETVRVWMEQNGHRNWQFGGLCDRRFADKLAEARRLFESSKSARKSLSDACDHLQRELDNAKRERDNAITDAKQFEVDCIRALKERNEAREQRDEVMNYLKATQRQLTHASAERNRLAEALHEVIEGRHGAFVRAKAALASVEGGGK